MSTRKAAAKRKLVVKEEEEEEKITVKKEKKEEEFKEKEPQTQEIASASSSESSCSGEDKSWCEKHGKHNCPKNHGGVSKEEDAVVAKPSVSEYAARALECREGDSKGDRLRRYLRATSDFARDSSFAASLDDDVARKWYNLRDEEIVASLPTALDVVKQLATFAVFQCESDGKYEKTLLFDDLLESAGNMAEAELDELVGVKFLLSETEDHKDADLVDELGLKSALHRAVAKLLLDKAEAAPTDWWRLLDVFARFCEQMKL